MVSTAKKVSKMKWTDPVTTPPEPAVRVLVSRRKNPPLFARRVLTADGKDYRWIDDNSKPVNDVIGWTFVVGMVEAE
jgi:hypothetical protein